MIRQVAIVLIESCAVCTKLLTTPREGSLSAPLRRHAARFTAGRFSFRLIPSPALSQSASAGAGCSQKGILRGARTKRHIPGQGCQPARLYFAGNDEPDRPVDLGWRWPDILLDPNLDPMGTKKDRAEDYRASGPRREMCGNSQRTQLVHATPNKRSRFSRPLP
jgi:hypothetical protein